MIDTVAPDIPRLYTALAEWAACMLFVVVTRKRFKGKKNLGLSLLFLVLISGVQLLAGSLPLAFWVPGMLLAVLSMYLCIYTMGDLNFIGAFFWTARAFVLAEFAASLEWQFHYYLMPYLPLEESTVFETGFLLAIYFIVFMCAFLLEKRYTKSNINFGVSEKDLIVAIGIATTIFLVSNISFISKNTPLSGRFAMEIFYIRTLVNLSGLILFYAQQEQRLWMHAKFELNAMQKILSRQHDNYCLSKENLELLHRRYHDLKHFINIVKAEENPLKRAEYIENMEKEIKMYEAQNKTGNKVLDVLLTNKSMTCIESDINFTCVADGSLLSFMDVMDICSIVGNALDNAIESVKVLEQKDKRIIKMAIFSQKNLLLMRFENYMQHSLNFEQGLPITTKMNKKEHGYGIKSIKQSAEKYGGNIKINAHDRWFSLLILIPLPNC